MSTAIEARSLIEQIGSGFPLGTPIKTIQDHVSRAVKLPVRRIRALWNGEVGRPYADEIEALRRAAAQRSKANQNELAELRAQLARIERALDQIGAGGHRQSDPAGRSHVGANG